MLTSARRSAFVAFGSLQLGSNVFESILVFRHHMISLVFIRINRRDLLRVRTLHIFDVFGVPNDVREAKLHLRWTSALALNLAELLSLLRHRHLSLRLFLLSFFLHLLELFKGAEKFDLKPFALLRHGL